MNKNNDALYRGLALVISFDSDTIRKQTEIGTFLNIKVQLTYARLILL